MIAQLMAMGGAYVKRILRRISSREPVKVAYDKPATAKSYEHRFFAEPKQLDTTASPSLGPTNAPPTLVTRL